MTDTHMKNGIMAQNMIYEQNMMKLVAEKKDTKFSCFDHKFGTLAAILMIDTHMKNDIMVYNVIHEQNFMKFVVWPVDT